ncbi:Transcriptional regulator Kaiso [Larimichthys crocea]|uniref:Uncharacterized protein n=1 Tax=Larimichthys crocea TaxID=215358 RepID=A0ACD3RCT4_LARCR|nr:Transcriptional regulator Kaiso [Larimichthys crocea]
MYPVTKKVEELLAKELFFTELNTTATCLICRQKVLYRVFNMKRHYTIKHAEQYSKYKEEERKVVSNRLHADFNYNKRSTGEPELKEEPKPAQITTVMPSLKLISATDTQYSAAVLKSMNEQRNHGLFCDVTIIIQDKKFRAHKTVLSASSTYFHQLFSVAGQVIELNFIRAEIFEEILNYIYSSKIVRVRSDMLEELINAGQILGVKFIANLGLPLSQVKGLPGLSKESENKNDTESTEMMPIITESFSISAEEFNQTSKSAGNDEDSDSDVMFVSQTDAQTKQKASGGEVIDLDSADSENVASKQK